MRSLAVALLLLVGLPYAAIADDFVAERRRAEALLWEGKTDEYASIIEQLSRQGDARSQAWYGYYHQRTGNYAEAEKWLLMSAQAGDSYGQLRLGALYFLMSPPRPIEAQKWLQMAAEQGNERAGFLLRQLASPPKEPHAVNGRVSTVELAEIQYSVLKRMLVSMDGVLTCYRTPPAEIDRVFVPAAKRCTEISVREYGSTIPTSDYYEFARDYSDCVRTIALRSLGIAAKELLECTRRIP